MAHPGGAPTKYDPIYCDMLIDHMSQGFSYESFPGRVLRLLKRKISRAVLYVWEKDYPEFLDAKMCAKDSRLLRLEEVLLGIGTGDISGNPTPMIFITKSAEQEMYGDKQNIKVEGDGANVMAAFSAQTLNAMYKDAKAKQAKE